MTVEEIRGDCDNFPMGLRVLAVDDDPICLKLLETLLRKCQYHVTTTSQARIALKMLRENKNIFDLVISDVHMPDMDGFKLLELVGLEMDLPVIMLSANGDPKLVMKGVTHGACDYLVKPVRIEELRNIWQHVIRRKKVDPKNQSKCNDQVKGGMEGQGSPLTGNTDGKLNRKRKDEEDESVENGNESEDPGTQKKPRVVWSIELHRKFVTAVKQLGIEKAVPKRILDLMNVEGLTRENVASHLQKYRLYLKRISSVQQPNMISALGVKDNPFMHMGSLDGLDNFQVLSGPRFSNIALSSSFASNGMNLRNLAPTTLIQPNHSQNLTNSISPLGKMHHILPSANQNASHLFQGMPSPFELSQLQPNNIDCSRSFANVASFRDLGEARTSNLLSNSNGNIASNAPQVLDFGEFRNHAPHEISSFGQESFTPGPSCLHQNGTTTTTTNNNNNNILLPDETFGGRQLPSLVGSQDSNCSNNAFFSGDPIELSSGMALVTCEPRQDYAQGGLRNNNVGTLNGIVSRLGQNSGILNQKMDMLVNGSSFSWNNVSEKAGVELGMGLNENVLMEQPRVQARFVRQSYDSLDELMNVMIKREQDETIPDFDFGVDDYSFGQGI